jgi:organic hydroperoxide reductase OsmC/OhrA
VLTYGGALEARGIPAGEGRLTSEVLGEIEKEGKVLVVKRIHVTYHLRLAPDKRDVAERVLGFHADFCPLARSIRGCVGITTSLELEDLPAQGVLT